MPQYLLSVWHDEPYDDLDFSSPEMERLGAQVSALNAELERAARGCSALGCVPRRRRPWCAPMAPTSR